MTKDALSVLLKKGELDTVQERMNRSDARIWDMVVKELGGDHVIASLSSGGGAMGGRVARPVPAPTIDIEARRLQQQKFIEGFHRYDELEKLGELEIQNRYIESFRLRKEREQQEYISKWRLGAAFPYWLKMPFWSYLEGAALVHGLDPRAIKSHDRDFNKTHFPIVQSWSECKEHAYRAASAGQLKIKSKPVEFLRWAESLGYPLPEGLQGLSGQNEAISKPAIDDAQPASRANLKVLKRENVLSPIIDEAITECGSSKTAAVWNKLREYAVAQKPPFYGITEDGLQYMNQDDIPKALSKRALGDRLKRLSTSR